ncbi:putative phospholipid-transporting ATPase IA [Auxenochlorella protothecoides]|uniref:Phospholipid-transporting ATPase n=1 Tax=Auxenochlorella protothecoides TaxID=3075 RepID=A0A087SAB5_AUXPR|nr:putative phospholipid-transporting ATPase IA [Auxenochlorella protothecoides]KFM22669.1 putative phospholipid-transporting ATPase IA [Auxenochlorella protothecoides]
MPKPRNDGLTVAIPEDAEVASEAPSGETSGPAELSSSSSRNKFSPGAVLNKMMPRQLTRVTSSAVARLRSSVDPRKQAALRAELQSNLERTDTPKVTKGDSRNGAAAQQLRVIHFDPQGGTTVDGKTPSNRVVTSKYNPITFLPIFLFEMFSRVAYLYFLLQACLSWWSVVSPFGGVGATAALVFVLLVAGIKAVWEDVKRHQEDKTMNASTTHRANPDGSITDISWTEVKVGDALVVRDDELFPADMVCLQSQLPDRVCFIRTTNLDGETNLKIRKPIDLKGIQASSVQEAMRLRIRLSAEAPNRNLHRFKGQATILSEQFARTPLSPGSDKMVWSGNGTAAGEEPHVNVPVTMNEMLLRGCMLKNSGSILGLVVYTGRESRIQMNAARTPNKVGSFDRFLNLQIGLVIAFQLVLVIFCAAANLVWQNTMGVDRYYLALNQDVQGIYSSDFVQFLINCLTFWILLSYLVPISLFVTLEIVKFWQGFVYINLDPAMKDPASGEHARCRNSGLNEDLGRVEYIFSDKTGTLTSNEMQLRAVAIKGVAYGDTSFRLEEHEELTDLAALQRFDPRLADAAAGLAASSNALQRVVSRGGSSSRVLSQASSFKRESEEGPQRSPGDAGVGTLSSHLMDFWTNLCICQSLILEDDPKGDKPLYQGPSPDEVALVEAARQLGFEFVSRSQTGLVLSMLGEEVEYEVLNILEYSSDRGCMSVIARAPDGTIRLFCKGSDAKVMRKVRPGTDPVLLRQTDENLHTFARQGLRTLVLGTRILEEQWHAAWDARYQEAASSFEDRDGKLDALGDEVERELELVGVTAIEDKLQDGVPAAIKTLLTAGIRVWMITGDKMETAVNIAVSCQLVKDPDSIMMLVVDEKQDDPATEADRLLDACMKRTLETYARSSGERVATLDQVPHSWQAEEMAVDGHTLNYILVDEALSSKLALLAAHCSGVVVSRSSPSQKAGVVRLMTAYEMERVTGTRRGLRRWYARYKRRLSGKMLSIGDGANDVAMLQTADVGVGIMGKEGRQATNNSDYAITQFRSYPATEADRLLDACMKRTLETYARSSGERVATLDQVPHSWQAEEMAVDGHTLNYILVDEALSSKLALLAAHCSGVVVSRSSPSQKAGVVRLMTAYEMERVTGTRRGLRRWYARYKRRLSGKMLSIGDGANDVAMLQTADVGVGIMGKEGRQATNNSDYAITQFRFLVPLLLVHGNLSYYRIARLIKYSFYKNITFAFVLFYYQFYNGFSGQALVDSITAAVFNVVFTSVPILLFAVLDRPVADLKTYIHYPRLYDKSELHTLTTASFWKTGVAQAVVHAAVCFFIPYYSIATSGRHNITDVYSLGKLAFVALLGTVNLEVALVARYWTVLFAVFVALSYFLVYPYMAIFPLIQLGLDIYDPANVGVSENVLASPTFWFVIIICNLTTFGLRFAERTADWSFKPQDTMIMAEHEEEARKQGKKWLQQNVSAESRLRLSSLGIEIPEEEEDTLRARHSPPRPTAPGAAHPGLPPA